MQISGGVRFCEQGMKASIRAMHLQSEILGIINENVTGFDKIGFQRREPVVSSFTEYLGVHGLSKTVDDQVGRIMVSQNPLDIALANKGYFQIQTPEGVKLTRDGRFNYDKEGYLIDLQDNKVLSDTGLPIKLPIIPNKPEQIVVNTKGKISVYDSSSSKVFEVGHLGIVDSNGLAVLNPDVKQGFNEHSNIILQNEFMAIKPIVHNFDANRNLFRMQNTNLQKVISQLGSSS
jgi:flagellar basal body rod protein FlgG